METIRYIDVVLRCLECRKLFVLTQGEARFAATKGLPRPSRCLMCRRNTWRVRPAPRSAALAAR